MEEMTLEQQQALALARARRRRAETTGVDSTLGAVDAPVGDSVDAPIKPKQTFGQMFKNEVLDSMPAQMLGAREYLSGTPQGIASAPPTRFAMGAAEPIQGAVQRLSESSGLRQAFPLMSLSARLSRQGLDESFARSKQLAKEGSGNEFNLAGLLGNIASPASLATGKVPIPASLLGKTALGVGAGGVGGALAPAENQDQAQQNALFGMGAGGVLAPVATGVAKGSQAFMNSIARPIADLFIKDGPMNIAKRYLHKVIGENQLPAVLNATRNVQEILPGGKPTVSQAVAGLPQGSPLNALQDIVAATAGGPSAAFGQRIADQLAAVDTAKVARTAASKINYEKAFDPKLHPVKADAELIGLANSPYFKQVLPAVSRVAEHKGLNFKDNLTEMLHNVKIGLDKKLNPGFGEVAIDNAERGAVMDVKDKLVSWLAKHNSDYEAGRAAHADASKLIDAYKLRQELAIKPLQPTNLGGGVNVAEETRPHVPNLLSRAAMASNFALRVAGKKLEPEVDRVFQKIFLDPSQFSTEMAKLSPKTRIDVERLLRNANVLTAGAASAQ